MNNKRIDGYLVKGEEIIYEVEGFKKNYNRRLNLLITDRRIIFDFTQYELLKSTYWHDIIKIIRK